MVAHPSGFVEIVGAGQNDLVLQNLAILPLHQLALADVGMALQIDPAILGDAEFLRDANRGEQQRRALVDLVACYQALRIDIGDHPVALGNSDRSSDVITLTSDFV